MRAALGINAGMERIFPERFRTAVAKRFEIEDVEHQRAPPYDMIRATVNLTTSALLISVATSLAASFDHLRVLHGGHGFVARRPALWGRESAVYHRISGVMTVVAGWFVTALGGFLIAFVWSAGADLRRYPAFVA